MKNYLTMSIPFVLMTLSALSVMANKYDDAMNLCQQFIDGYEKIRTIDREDEKALVKAVCDAEDDDRNEIGKRAAERVESDVKSNFEALKDTKEKAEKLISDLKNDGIDKNKMDELYGKQERMNVIMPRLERILEKCRAGNNPVFKTMSKYGMEAHKIYQQEHSDKGVAEFEVSGGKKIDFINYDCTCIEIKANNSSSVSKGENQLKDYIADLRKDEYFNKLLGLSSEAKTRFSACKTFVPKIVRYNFCPQIDEDGNIVSASLQWED